MDQKKIGEFIARCRKEKGMTQAQLARAAGVSDRAVSKWENGRSLPDSANMLPVCEALGITVIELLNGERIEKSEFERASSVALIEVKSESDDARFQGFIFTVLVCLSAAAVILLIIWINANNRLNQSVYSTMEQLAYSMRHTNYALKDILMEIVR